MKKSIKYSHKHVSDCLSNESSITIFLQPTDKEIANISSLNSSKASDPNKMLYKILLLKNEIFKQLADLFNLSFKKKTKTLWPLFMDGVQLPQG